MPTLDQIKSFASQTVDKYAKGLLDARLFDFLAPEPSLDLLVKLITEYNSLRFINYNGNIVSFSLAKLLKDALNIVSSFEHLTIFINLLVEASQNLKQDKLGFRLRRVLDIIWDDYNIVSFMIESVDTLSTLEIELAQKCKKNCFKLWKLLIGKPVFSELIRAYLEQEAQLYQQPIDSHSETYYYSLEYRICLSASDKTRSDVQLTSHLCKLTSCIEKPKIIKSLDQYQKFLAEYKNFIRRQNVKSART